MVDLEIMPIDRQIGFHNGIHRTFHALYDLVPNAVIVLDQERNIVFLNKEAETLFHYHPDEAMDLNFLSAFISDKFKSTIQRNMDSIKAEKGLTDRPIYAKAITKDGSEVFCKFSMTSLPLENRHYILIVSHEATSIKTMQDLSRLKSIVDFLQVGIIVTDTEWTIIYTNQATRDILGYTAISADGSADELTGIDVRDILSLVLPCEDSLYNFKGFGLEANIKRKDGADLIVSLTFDVIMDNDEIPFAVAISCVDNTETKKNERQMVSLMKDMRMLLKEIHHRVKNNLQIISSLLSLQADRIEGISFKNIFKDSQNRIQSMALIHERLYMSNDLAEIDVAEYIQALSSELLYSYTDSYAINLDLDISVGSLDVDLLVPCGLVINELLSNALKYAFPTGRKGIIMISFNRNSDGKYSLIISDDGIGIPEEWDINKTDSLGLQLVNDLITKKLNGKIELDRTVGTKFIMVF
ncbi:MAG: PAS domain S-box protein [Nitrospirae bacterium]|nr:PAS domain S-box protein [Nitrospirota bacterium]